MISFQKEILSNGLTLIHHEDKTSPLVVLNILYKVGARDEDENRTGFAHLFEHLMFGGSINIPEYDGVLQIAGGENNAFTTNDITNYYLNLPAENAETGFWLESDRMLSLAFSPESLEVQRNVVIEEFKQRYLNQPYGDVWLKLRELCYKKHPYKWATIGKEIKHIEEAKMEEVKEFFNSFYSPKNAILVVAGNIDYSRTLELTKKWFGSIESREINRRLFEQEPKQNEKRLLEVKADVPVNALYMAFHTYERKNPGFYACDLLIDILSQNQSSLLFKKIIREKGLCSEIHAYQTENLDPGLFIIDAKLNENVDYEKLEEEIINEIKGLRSSLLDSDLEKVKNKKITLLSFSRMEILNRAMELAFFENLGSADLINEELKNYQSVNKEDILKVIDEVINFNNCSILRYKSNDDIR